MSQPAPTPPMTPPNNNDAYKLSQNILQLLDEENVEHLDPLTKYAAIQIASFAVYTALLGWFVQEKQFDEYRTILLGLHDKLTVSMLSVQPEYLAATRASLMNGHSDGVVH